MDCKICKSFCGIFFHFKKLLKTFIASDLQLIEHKLKNNQLAITAVSVSCFPKKQLQTAATVKGKQSQEMITCSKPFLFTAFANATYNIRFY